MPQTHITVRTYSHATIFTETCVPTPDGSEFSDEYKRKRCGQANANLRVVPHIKYSAQPQEMAEMFNLARAEDEASKEMLYTSDPLALLHRLFVAGRALPFTVPVLFPATFFPVRFFKAFAFFSAAFLASRRAWSSSSRAF